MTSTDGKPGVITNQQGTTVNTYDSAGNLISTTNPVGDTTSYTYTDDSDPLVPAGLLLTTSTNGQQVGFNTYYGTADGYGTVATPVGTPSEAGMLASTTDASGVTHSYSYDAYGNKVSDILNWTAPDGTAWNNETDYSYDVSGRVISTTSNYIWQRSDPNDPTSARTTYSNAAGTFSGVTTQTHYNALGQQDYTTDQYGQRTYSVYDSNGNVVDTIYPNGTESRTVYDAMGRAIWSSGTYASGTTVNPSTGVIAFDNTTASPTATETVYNALGQSVQTLSYANVVIPITSDSIGGTSEAASPTLGAGEQPYATTSTTYNAQGQVASQTDAGGLTTVTNYYPNGQVASTGPVTTPGTPTTNTYYDPKGQLWTLAISGSISAGDSFTVTVTGSDGTTHDTLAYTAPSAETASDALAALAAAINAASTDPSQGQALFRGITAVVQGNAIRLAADPSHQPITVSVAKSSAASFTTTADPSQVVRVVELMPTGINGDGTFTLTFTDPNTGAVETLSVTPTGSSEPDFSAAMAAAIDQAANDPTDYPLLTNVSAEDMSGYVRLLEGGSDANDLPLVTPTVPQYYSPQMYAFGLSTTVTQDADGNWSATQTDPSGRTVWSVAPDGGVTQTLYGSGGLPVAGHGIYLQQVTGYQQTVIDPLGNTTDSFYNSAGQLTDVYQPAIAYDGDTTQMIRPHWRYAYDSNGNLNQTENPNNDTTTSTYDPLGNEISRTLPDGRNTETWVYDKYGRLYQSTDFDGNTQTDSYYSSGADVGMLQGVTYAGPGKTTETVSYAYTALGQKSTVIDSADGTTTYTYDPITGNVASVTSPQGTVNYVYDPATGRLIETWTGTTHASATTDTLYGYDTQGELASVISPQGTVNYVYDPATGRLIETWSGTSHATATTDTLYGYNLQGELDSVTVAKQNGTAPAAPAAQYAGFDARGDGEPRIGLPTTLYMYDADGNMVRQLNPNGTETDDTYDAVADEQSVVNKMTTNGQVLSSYVYQSDLDGRRTSDSESRLNNTGATYTVTNITWSYDAISHLTQETYSDGITADDYTDVYTYDLDGNRNSKTHTSGVAASDQQIDYSYDEDDQLTSEGTDNSFTTSTALQYSTSYAYDNNGSMISATVNGVTAAYTYDDAGNRVGQTVSGTTTTYLVDGNNPSGYVQVLEERSGSILSSYVTGRQGVISQNANGTVTYLLMDGHGSTRLLTNSAGQITGEYDYDAFGDVLTLSTGSKAWASTASTPYQFAGMRADASSGMDLTESRSYVPSEGRFPTADDIDVQPGDLANANLYVYVGADPVNFVDPNGHDVAEELGVMGIDAILMTLVVGGAATMAIKQAGHLDFNLGINDEITGLLSSGNQALVQAGTLMAANTAVVDAAISNALSLASGAAVAAWKAAYSSPSIPPIYPVIKSMGSAVYALDVAALKTHPWWYVLNYNGTTPAGIARTDANRLSMEVWRPTIPSGQSLDEFPYASTTQGGAKAGAVAGGVPLLQNLVQGGLLSAFYGYSLRTTRNPTGTNAPFLVVPVPL